MKRLLSFFILGAAVVIAIAATVKISDLPLSTSPSTNTFIEIADMNAATKSLKYPLDSVPSYARITNAMSWSGNTNNLIGGDGRERTVAWGSSPWTNNSTGSISPDPITNKVILGPGVNNSDWTNFGTFGGMFQAVAPLNTDLSAAGANFVFELSGNDSAVANGAFPVTIQTFDGGWTGNLMAGLGVYTEVHGPTNPVFSVLYTGSGGIGIRSEIVTPNFDYQRLGQSTALFAINDGYHSTNIGVAAVGQVTSGTNRLGIASASSAQDFNHSPNAMLIGSYVEIVNEPYPTPNPQYESSVLLLDNRATGLPLITARTNNGTHVFQVSASGAVSAGSTNAWQFGALKTCSGVTIIVTNYLEVIINGVTNAIPLGTITP